MKRAARTRSYGTRACDSAIATRPPLNGAVEHHLVVPSAAADWWERRSTSSRTASPPRTLGDALSTSTSWGLPQPGVGPRRRHHVTHQCGLVCAQPDIRHQLPNFRVSELPSGDVINLPPLSRFSRRGRPALLVRPGVSDVVRVRGRGVPNARPEDLRRCWLTDVVRGLGSPRIKRCTFHAASGTTSTGGDRSRREATPGLDARQRGPDEVRQLLVDVGAGQVEDPEHSSWCVRRHRADYEIPDGIIYLTAPPQSVIVDEIYNRSRGSSTRASSRASASPASKRWRARAGHDIQRRVGRLRDTRRHGAGLGTHGRRDDGGSH